jgi:hypothetical protein
VLVLSGLGIVKQTRFPAARALALNIARSITPQVSNEFAAETLRRSPLETVFDLFLFLPKSPFPFS